MVDIQLVADKNPFDSLVEFINAIAAPTVSQQRIVGDAIRQGMAENIIGEHDGTGKSWPKLSPLTNSDRRDEGFPVEHPMLVRRGILTGSYLQVGRPDHIERLESTGDGWTLTIGSDNERASLQEFGGNTFIKGRPARIPPRPITILSDQTEERTGEAIEQMIDEIKRVLLSD